MPCFLRHAWIAAFVLAATALAACGGSSPGGQQPADSADALVWGYPAVVKGGQIVITPPGWTGTLPLGAQEVASPTPIW
jgi:hypothetical protein